MTYIKQQAFVNMGRTGGLWNETRVKNSTTSENYTRAVGNAAVRTLRAA